MPIIQDYDRETAVRYAHECAYRRNPAYYNYDNIGGDCINFVSRCIVQLSFNGRIFNKPQWISSYYEISTNFQIEIISV